MDLSYVTAGESHGPGLTVVISGVPAGLELERDAIRRDLARRQAGYGRSPRQQLEKDDARPLRVSATAEPSAARSHSSSRTAITRTGRIR